MAAPTNDRATNRYIHREVGEKPVKYKVRKSINMDGGVAKMRRRQNGCRVRCSCLLQILLLCGPPGLGKTTLAHVAAKHCGYRVVEVLFFTSLTWIKAFCCFYVLDFHLCFTIAEGHFTDSLCFCFFLDINASDDRSSSTIEAKILDVVQMNSVMADSKPNCLVIDEIEGALGDGKGTVEVILKMVIDMVFHL
ncbi:hypothetical protein CK203_051407 [Vitis vinifera]|uniref:ATPase AAA-type core domain-containing protein n=1 Tax=Vitis vinifera TaxID=29760 RepID=A0A438H1Q0_VITVI|nr:hypothetical protein CK203_051407 [Vitis vinifera]